MSQAKQNILSALVNLQGGPRELGRKIIAYINAGPGGGKVDMINKSIMDYVAYDIRLVTGLQQVRFFNGTLLPNQTNQTNGYIRPQNEHMIITGMGLKMASVTAATEFGAEELVFTKGLLPAVAGMLHTGKISILNNTTTELADYPLSELINVAELNDSGISMFNKPIIWMHQTPLVVTLEAGANTPIADGILDVWLECDLYGLAFQA